MRELIMDPKVAAAVFFALVGLFYAAEGYRKLARSSALPARDDEEARDHG